MRVVIEVYVKPGAARPGLGGVFDGRPVLRVAAPPADGRANREVCDTVAELLDAPRAAVSVCAGQRSRRKHVAVETDDPAALRARWDALVDSSRS